MRNLAFLLALVAFTAHGQDSIDFGPGGGSLPSQTGNSGKYLTTDGSSASWATLSGGGDMAAATYDPGGVAGDAFDRSNHSGALTVDDGDITVDRGGDATSSSLLIETDAGQQARVLFRTGNSTRWSITKNQAAESGSDAGSNFVLTAFTDGSISKGAVIDINRATLLTTFPNSVEVTGTLTVGGVPVPSADTSAATECTGTDTYLDGEGNCDDFSAGTFGRSITFSSNTASADAELYTRIEPITIPDPTTADSGDVQLMFPLAVTITRVACSTDVGTVSIQFDERAAATPNTSGTDILGSPAAALVCDSNEEATTAFNNAGIASRVPMNLDIDAVASSPTVVRIFVEYTFDD